jgi:hypothetical protein
MTLGPDVMIRLHVQKLHFWYNFHARYLVKSRGTYFNIKNISMHVNIVYLVSAGIVTLDRLIEHTPYSPLNSEAIKSTKPLVSSTVGHICGDIPFYKIHYMFNTTLTSYI